MANAEYKQAAENVQSYVSESGFEIPTSANDIKNELDLSILKEFD